MRNQRTLRNAASLTGPGLHLGAQTTLTLKPAEPDTGIVFVRTDERSRPRIACRPDHAVRRERQTVLSDGAFEVQTVEHLLASLGALGVDNVEIEIDGPEVPGADGSALPFVKLIEEAGRVEQKASRRQFALDEPLTVAENGAVLTALPNRDGLAVSYTLDYPGLPPQFASYVVDERRFIDEIAPARTFCMEAEAEALRGAGLGRGATTQNTLVVGRGGVIDNSLRFPDEFARHKILDLIGDLTLLGVDLRAHVIATKSGHRNNLALVARIEDRLEDLENRGVIQRDTGLDVREVMKIIPHRYPFLFIDRVISLEGFQRAVAVKNVSINEPFFQGHWPGQPVMPGVLQVEALAQLSGVLLLRRLENTGKVAVLLSIDKIKFRRPVVPGDQLRLEAETRNIKSRAGKVLGRARVNGELTCEAIMKFMLVDA